MAQYVSNDGLVNKLFINVSVYVCVCVYLPVSDSIWSQELFCGGPRLGAGKETAGGPEKLPVCPLNFIAHKGYIRYIVISL